MVAVKRGASAPCWASADFSADAYWAHPCVPYAAFDYTAPLREPLQLFSPRLIIEHERRLTRPDVGLSSTLRVIFCVLGTLFSERLKVCDTSIYRQGRRLRYFRLEATIR